MNNDQDVPGPSDATVILTFCALGLCMMTLLVIGAYSVGSALVHHIPGWVDSVSAALK